MYRFLWTRQWVLLTLLGVLLIPTMIRLGFWQLHRHEARVARNDLIGRNLDARAVPVGTLSSPHRDLPRADVWRRVTATGSYDSEDEVVVRQRTSEDGRQGYFVLTPLRRADGSAVLVNRGWVSAGGDLTRYPKVPPAPSGKVTVTGWLQADETTDSGIRDKKGLPPRQVMLINSEQRAAQGLEGPVLSGFIQLTGTAPEPAGKQPELVAAPNHSDIGPHMAYAVQWWLFSAGVPVGWWVLVRRERREREAAAKGDAQDGASDTRTRTSLASPEHVTAD